MGVVSSSSLQMVLSHFFGPVPPAASHVVSIGTQTAFVVPPTYKYTQLIILCKGKAKRDGYRDSFAGNMGNLP